MMLQLNPPIPVVTPKGDAMAILVIDYGPALNTIWVCVDDETLQIFHVDSCELKHAGNEMWNQPHPQPIEGRRV